MNILPLFPDYHFQPQGLITMSKRAEYIDKMEVQLDKLNKKMHDLEATAKEAKEEARQKYKDEMVKLREQSKVATVKLDEMKASGVDAWEHMVTDMEKMHDAFTHSFFSMFQAFGSREPDEKTAKKDDADPSTKA